MVQAKTITTSTVLIITCIIPIIIGIISIIMKISLPVAYRVLILT